jgi:hypothetical protein
MVFKSVHFHIQARSSKSVLKRIRLFFPQSVISNVGEKIFGSKEIILKFN